MDNRNTDGSLLPRSRLALTLGRDDEKSEGLVIPDKCSASCALIRKPDILRAESAASCAKERTSEFAMFRSAVIARPDLAIHAIESRRRKPEEPETPWHDLGIGLALASLIGMTKKQRDSSFRTSAAPAAR